MFTLRRIIRRRSQLVEFPRQRLITALIVGSIFLVGFFTHPLTQALLILLLIILSCVEYHKQLQTPAAPLAMLLIPALFPFFIAMYICQGDVLGYIPTDRLKSEALIIFAGLSSSWMALLVTRMFNKNPTILWARFPRMHSMLWIGIGYSSLLTLYHFLPNRPYILMALIFLIWASDIFAYFSGKRWGHKLLAPSISPKKTWEGVYGAIAAVLLLSIGFAQWIPGASLLHWTGAGLIIVGGGISGDLFESSMKRLAGVKDSGTILPGHGGILDRFDALIVITPLLVLYFYWTGLLTL